MKIYKTISEFVAWRNNSIAESIGFVPTMGALHQGHLSLVRNSKQNNVITVVSIFVNQLQFSPNEDFENYPRNVNEDLNLLEKEGVDVVLLPTHNELYGVDYGFTISENILSKKLEGQSRPDFFNGVCTIVCKLFNIVLPTQSFFGMKDIQQLIIIKKLVKDLNFNVEIVSCETVRENNGLAMSSRNQYLSDLEKDEASQIYHCLKQAKIMVEEKQTYSTIIKDFKINIEKNQEMKVDYVSIANLNTFDEFNDHEDIKKTDVVISCAVFFKNVRLIDNIVVL
ncbi:MAG: pantoate--beta-alanine ligase [Candidatus Marinimicrobia bacterium]|nr:pantoate--beta-alanine ligase [Candidatus Neomarinimicrobiota bacterium]